MLWCDGLTGYLLWDSGITAASDQKPQILNPTVHTLHRKNPTETTVMAEKTEPPKLQNTETASREEEPRNPNPFFSLFPKLTLFNFPPLKLGKPKPETVVSDQSTSAVINGNEESSDGTKPDVVKFSDPRPAIAPPLKLEAEDCEQNTNPIVLWQVYAIGGFFVLKWLWARWEERRAKKKSSDDEPSPADD